MNQTLLCAGIGQHGSQTQYWIELAGTPKMPHYVWCIQLDNGLIWRSKKWHLSEKQARTAAELFKYTRKDEYDWYWTDK